MNIKLFRLQLTPLKGKVPLTRTYSTTPSDQISTFGPLYSLPSNNSGAAYGGDPHQVDIKLES